MLVGASVLLLQHDRDLEQVAENSKVVSGLGEDCEGAFGKTCG
jgi:hypothetical protein